MRGCVCVGREAGRARRILSLLCAVTLALSVDAKRAAADPLEPPQTRYGWREVWAGVDAARDVWFLYSGVTLAPWSEHIHADGLRLRASGGYGHYSYTGATVTPTPCGSPRYDPCVFAPKRFNVDQSYIDALVGYQKRIGELTAKGFVGVAGITHRFDTRDPRNAVEGEDFGVKGVLELWLNLGTNAWTSLDVSYTTAHDTGSARWRGGWRALQSLSAGPEVHYNVNAQDDAGRAGGFVRHEWQGGEISLAGGWSGTITGGETQDWAPYGTINVLLQY